MKSVEGEEASADLIISTGHKAKGREWDSVTLHSDFEPRISKEPPHKQVLNQEEARLLYVATTRAKELLVVPPRLAEKWNVPAAPSIPNASVSAIVFPEHAPTSPAKQKKLPPKLPSFAKVVNPRPDAESSAMDDHAPHKSPPPSTEHIANTSYAQSPQTRTTGESQAGRSSAVTTGLVGAILGFLFG